MSSLARAVGALTAGGGLVAAGYVTPALFAVVLVLVLGLVLTVPLAVVLLAGLRPRSAAASQRPGRTRPAAGRRPPRSGRGCA